MRSNGSCFARHLDCLQRDNRQSGLSFDAVSPPPPWHVKRARPNTLGHAHVGSHVVDRTLAFQCGRGCGSRSSCAR